jgi:hypothetical protein
MKNQWKNKPTESSSPFCGCILSFTLQLAAPCDQLLQLYDLIVPDWFEVKSGPCGHLPADIPGSTAWALARIKHLPFLFEVRDSWPAFAIAGSAEESGADRRSG